MRRISGWIVPLMLLSACAAESEGQGPDGVQVCSGHGIWDEGADPAGACSRCEKGYTLVTWLTRNPTKDVPGEATWLCLKAKPTGGHGMARADGELPTPAQVDSLNREKLRWTQANLPLSRDTLPERMVVIGRIALDAPDLTPESAVEQVDRAFSGGKPDLVVIDDRFFAESRVADIPGNPAGPEMMEWLATRLDAVCAATMQARRHCQDCLVGFSSAFSLVNQVYFMMQQMGAQDRWGACFFDFAEQVFDEVDVADFPPAPDPWGNLKPQLLPEYLACPTCRFMVARVKSFKPETLPAQAEEAAVQEILTALEMREAGFSVVLLPGLGSDGGATAFTEEGAALPPVTALKTLETNIGAGTVAATGFEGLLGVQSERPALTVPLAIALDPTGLLGIWASWELPTFFLQDTMGTQLGVLTTESPAESQLQVAQEAKGPIYVLYTPNTLWPGSMTQPGEPFFQNAFVPDQGIYPSGESALNLDGDPELEWFDMWRGIIDPMGGSQHRVVMPSVGCAAWFDLDGDADLDCLSAMHIEPAANTPPEEGGVQAAERYVAYNHNDLWFSAEPSEEDPGTWDGQGWTLTGLSGPPLPRDLTGDARPDLLGVTEAEVIVHESTGTPGEFISHSYPQTGEALPERCVGCGVQVLDLDGDGLFDILELGYGYEESRPLSIPVSGVLLQRTGEFVRLPAPCPSILATMEQVGLQDEMGPGFICTGQVDLQAWVLSGETYTLAWSAPPGDWGDMPVVLPYRASDGAKTQVLISGWSGIELGTPSAQGIEWQWYPGVGQVVTSAYSVGPTGKSYLVGRGLAFETPQQAQGLLPQLPEWNPWVYNGEQLAMGDLDDDGTLDLASAVTDSTEFKEINEVGHPYVSWREHTQRLAVVHDFLGPEAESTPLGEPFVVRYPAIGCVETPDEGEVFDAEWSMTHVVGQFDSVPGDDAVFYSPLRYSLLDIAPQVHRVSGKTGEVTTFESVEYLGLEPLGDSTACTFHMMAADMDEDGIDDVMLWDKRQNVLNLLCSDGTGALGPTPRHETAPLSLDRIVGKTDVNHDGHMDLMAVEQQQLVFYLGDGQCDISARLEYTLGINTQFHNPFSCDDYDGDGIHECFFQCLWELNPERTETHCVVELPSKSSPLSEETWMGIASPTPAVSADAQLADFDKDGVMEILVGGSVVRLLADRVEYLGTYLPKPVLVLGDVNGDGTDDAMSENWQLLQGNAGK